MQAERGKLKRDKEYEYCRFAGLPMEILARRGRFGGTGSGESWRKVLIRRKRVEGRKESIVRGRG